MSALQEGGPEPHAGQTPDADAAAARQSSPASTSAAAAGPGPSSKPRALRAWFYRQPVLLEADAGVAVQLPAGVTALPGADGSLVGYGPLLERAERAFRWAPAYRLVHSVA